MASHSQKLAWWGDRICGKGRIDVSFMGRYPVRIQPEMADAVTALEHALMFNGYRLPIDATGSYACRKISGTNTWSLHAVPIAIDVDYPNNPVLRHPLEPGFGTDPQMTITERQVQAAEAITNTHGEQVWKWLGWRTPHADPMHFEIDVPPDRLELDVTYKNVLNVPDADWARNVVDWGIDVGMIINDDEHQDDWEKNIDYGATWTLFKRMLG